MSATSPHGRSPRVSVIVPVLNEAARIGRCLEALSGLKGLHEVIIVDGGSSDKTVEVARQKGGATVLSAPRGRASQMNAGAKVAAGDTLLFLHADVTLPQDGLECISITLSGPGVVAGAFRTWTVDDSGTSRLGPLLHLADLRSRYTRLPYGDQGLFVRADVFWKAGGFPPQELMEDLELSRRLRRFGRLEVVRSSVLVSGRRFVARPIWYTFLVNVFPLLYRLGVPPGRLAALYGHPR